MISLIINLIDYTNKLKILKFFKKRFNKNLINVIDIGGHKGETLEFFLKNFNVNKIFVFEPNKKLFDIIKNKFKKKNIHIFNYGVGFEKEIKNLNITIDSASSTINKINTNTEYFKRKKKILNFVKKILFLLKKYIKVKILYHFLLNKEKN